jgi:hypothetical protein
MLAPEKWFWHSLVPLGGAAMGASRNQAKDRLMKEGKGAAAAVGAQGFARLA